MSENPFSRPRIELHDGDLASVVVDGRPVTYRDVGDGPIVLLAQGSSKAPDFWAPLVAELSTRYRVLAPHLLGYGRFESQSINMRLHPWSDCATLLALAEHVADTVHLVGHSYGGTVALETARALGKRTRSLTLVEPIAFHLLRLSTRSREWRELPTYGRVDTPTRLLVGQRTPAPARAIVDELARVLPDAHLRVLPGAGHMSPVTHPRELAALITEHIDSVESPGEPERGARTPQREHRRSIA